MQLTQTQKIVSAVIIVGLLFGLYIIVFHKQNSVPVPVATVATTTDVTATTTSGITIHASGGGTYTIEQVPMESVSVPKPIPDVSRPVVFDSHVNLDSSVRAIVVAKVAELQGQLKKQPGYLGGWIYLGLYQKMAGDYAGALISWQYAIRLTPSNFVAYGNLGDLYAYYLHDNGRAEVYYNQAISKGPTQSYLYVQFASFYRDVEKDTTKAAAIIDQGLKQIPGDPSLLQFKQSLSATS